MTSVNSIFKKAFGISVAFCFLRSGILSKGKVILWKRVEISEMGSSSGYYGSMAKKRIVIVEDHEEMQILYKAMFRREKGIEIAAQVSDAEDALNVIKESNPDLVIVDITLPGMSGIEFVEQVHESFPGIKFLIVTGHDSDRFYESAKKAGADDLITKGESTELVSAVRRLLGIT